MYQTLFDSLKESLDTEVQRKISMASDRAVKIGIENLRREIDEFLLGLRYAVDFAVEENFLDDLEMKG